MRLIFFECSSIVLLSFHCCKVKVLKYPYMLLYDKILNYVGIQAGLIRWFHITRLMNAFDQLLVSSFPEAISFHLSYYLSY